MRKIILLAAGLAALLSACTVVRDRDVVVRPAPTATVIEHY